MIFSNRNIFLARVFLIFSNVILFLKIKCLCLAIPLNLLEPNNIIVLKLKKYYVLYKKSQKDTYKYL